jgi:hypothetical protein
MDAVENSGAIVANNSRSTIRGISGDAMRRNNQYRERMVAGQLRAEQ